MQAWEEKYYERQKGIEEGREKGLLTGFAESTLSLLSDYCDIPDELHEKIVNEKDLETLKKWNKCSAKASTLDGFLRLIKK